LALSPQSIYRLATSHPCCSRPSIEGACYLACLCSVSPLNKCYASRRANHRNCITMQFGLFYLFFNMLYRVFT
jgi:hypothetical protein